MEKVEMTIIGAGAVGTAVAYELSKAGREVFVFEKNEGVTKGENQSSRNSGVIHSGVYYDRKTRPLKARLTPLGNRLLYDFCHRHHVPHLPCGKLIVAASESDRENLEIHLRRAWDNGVEARMLNSREVEAKEPNVKALSAIYLPSAGVIDPTRLVYTLYALASNNGARFVAGAEVISATRRAEGSVLTVRYPDGQEDSFLSQKVVNCAGLYADRVARMFDSDSPYRVDPIRGESARIYRSKRWELISSMNIYPAPFQVETPMGKYWVVGVHLTPTIEPAPEGGWTAGPVTTVGPITFPAKGREDFGGEFKPMADYFEKASRYFPGLEESDLEPHQAGVLAYLAGQQDWVVIRDRKHPKCLHMLGIDSPGLTACLALAEHIGGLVSKIES